MPTNLPPPSVDDLARDAAADLALCDAATPGPLRLSPIAATVCDARGAAVCHFFQGSTPETKRQAEADAAFFIAARDALPAWIRRAQAAEADVVRLQAIVDSLAARIAAQSALLTRRAEKEPDHA